MGGDEGAAGLTVMVVRWESGGTWRRGEKRGIPEALVVKR